MSSAQLLSIGISVLALVASAFAILYARRAARAAEWSAREAKRLSDVEVDRRHDERTPELKGSITKASGGGWYRMDIELRSDIVVDRLSVELPEHRSVRIVSTANGALLTADSWEGPLTLGETATWRLDVDESEHGRELDAVVIVEARDDRWRVHVTLKPPIKPIIL